MYLLTLILLILTSCSQYKESEKETDYVELLRVTTRKYDLEIWKEHKLRLCGHGGALRTDISGVFQHFSSHEKLDLSKSRNLTITCVEKLLKMINENPKLHPFLHEVPFPAQRIEFSVDFCDSNGNFYKDSTVDYVFVQDGNIYYKKWNPLTEKFDAVHKETYEEALKTFNSNQRPFIK